VYLAASTKRPPILLPLLNKQVAGGWMSSWTSWAGHTGSGTWRCACRLSSHARLLTRRVSCTAGMCRWPTGIHPLSLSRVVCQSLAVDGRLVLLGMLGGFASSEPTNTGVLLRKRASVIGSTLRNRSADFKGISILKPRGLWRLSI
jgi:hypothetical protein